MPHSNHSRFKDPNKIDMFLKAGNYKNKIKDFFLKK